MSALRLQGNFLRIRVAGSALLLAAGVSAVEALLKIPAAREVFDNTYIGGMDAAPAALHFLFKWHQAILALTAVGCLAALCGVWLARRFVVVITIILFGSLLLLLEPPAIRFVLKMAVEYRYVHFHGK